MKIDEPFYAAFNKDGSLASSYEGYLIAGIKQGLKDELDAWSIPHSDVEIKRVVMKEEPKND